MAYRTKNLNLIPILQMLLKEASVAKAADQIGLSQPAVSGALARLRVLLDDPLLVRVGRTMRLTPRALRMRQRLDDVCVQLESLFRPERFDAATAHHSFVVAAPDYLALLLSDSLITRLRAQAPGIRLRFVTVPGDLPMWLRDGGIDLAVCGDFGFWPDLKREHLLSNRMVAAVAKGHPLIRRSRVTSNDLLEFPGVDFDTYIASSTRGTQFVTGVPSLNLTSQLSTGQFVDEVLLALRLPVVARAPASLVGWLSEFLPLVTIELAGEETAVEESMFWAPITEEAPQHIWLRAMVRQCIAPLAKSENKRGE
jgi:DNA-binding transcriptional LysR family regulator